jgi:hypothetical protein
MFARPDFVSGLEPSLSSSKNRDRKLHSDVIIYQPIHKEKSHFPMAAVPMPDDSYRDGEWLNMQMPALDQEK